MSIAGMNVMYELTAMVNGDVKHAILQNNYDSLTGPCSKNDSGYIRKLEISKIKKTFLLCQTTQPPEMHS